MKERIGSEAKRLHDRMLEAGKRFFSLDEAVSIGGKTHNATGLLLGRLCEKGWAMRICEGRYALAGDGEGMLCDPLVVGRELAGGEGYYVSHGSAMAVWGMKTYPPAPTPALPDDPHPDLPPERGKEVKEVIISLKGRRLARREVMGVRGMKTYPRLPCGSATRTPALPGDPHPGLPPERGKEVETPPRPSPNGEGEVVISLKGRRLASREVMGVRYRFVKDAEIEPWKLAGGGRPHPGPWLTVEVEVMPNEFVRVSDPEWTIVSGLGRPDLCGGVEGLLRALELWRERIDLERLMLYANLARNRTAPRRLGYLLDLAGIQTEVSRLSLGLSVLRNYRKLEPGVTGELEGSWRLEVREGFGEGGFLTRI